MASSSFHGQTSSLWAVCHWGNKREGRGSLEYLSTRGELIFRSRGEGLNIKSCKLSFGVIYSVWTVSYQHYWKFMGIYSAKEIPRITTTREHSKCFWPDFHWNWTPSCLVYWVVSHSENKAVFTALIALLFVLSILHYFEGLSASCWLLSASWNFTVQLVLVQ